VSLNSNEIIVLNEKLYRRVIKDLLVWLVFLACVEPLEMLVKKENVEQQEILVLKGHLEESVKEVHKVL
jgi:hypothetical protein